MLVWRTHYFTLYDRPRESGIKSYHILFGRIERCQMLQQEYHRSCSCMVAFEEVRWVCWKKLSPVLYTSEVGKPWHIQTDSSGTAICACIGQFDKDCNERPIANTSAKLPPNHCTSLTIEREAYGLIWALRNFKFFRGHWEQRQLFEVTRHVTNLCEVIRHFTVSIFDMWVIYFTL